MIGGNRWSERAVGSSQKSEERAGRASPVSLRDGHHSREDSRPRALALKLGAGESRLEMMIG